MDTKYWIFIVVAVLVSGTVIYALQLSQDLTEWEMLPYNNTTVKVHTGFILKVDCPFGHRDNLTNVGIVQEHKKDSAVSDMRLKITTIWYCEKHEIMFSVVGDR